MKDWVEFDNTLIIYLHDHDNDTLHWKDKNSVGWKRFNALPEWLKDQVGFYR